MMHLPGGLAVAGALTASVARRRARCGKREIVIACWRKRTTSMDGGSKPSSQNDSTLYLARSLGIVQCC